MTDPQAPHGRDGNGVPLAPYGLNMNGTPRKSNRGARPGQRGNKGPGTPKNATVRVSNLSDLERKSMLCELADMTIVTPLASASQIPVLASRIGPKQADALAGDAFILAQYMPGLADGLIMWSKKRPATLAWLDKAEESGPALLIASQLLAVGKALLQNHLNPNPAVANAGRSLAALKVAQMADAVNREAARMQAPHDPYEAPETVDFDAAEAAAYSRVTQEVG